MDSHTILRAGFSDASPTALQTLLDGPRPLTHSSPAYDSTKIAIINAIFVGSAQFVALMRILRTRGETLGWMLRLQKRFVPARALDGMTVSRAVVEYELLSIILDAITLSDDELRTLQSALYRRMEMWRWVVGGVFNTINYEYTFLPDGGLSISR